MFALELCVDAVHVAPLRRATTAYAGARCLRESPCGAPRRRCGPRSLTAAGELLCSCPWCPAPQFKHYVWEDYEFLLADRKERARLGTSKRTRGDGKSKRGLQ